MTAHSRGMAEVYLVKVVLDTEPKAPSLWLACAETAQSAEQLVGARYPTEMQIETVGPASEALVKRYKPSPGQTIQL